jgi:putative oxygen-independent coproporphyrinogen III oxidase
MLELPPLSLYIHIPWCVKKCPYCDFNSHEASQSLPEAEYVNALISDFENDWSRIEPRQIHSIFIGGGTPSLFSANSFAVLLKNIRTISGYAEDIEITLEANPGTAEAEKFRAFREIGINRLSIGIQSFEDQQLKNLGRIHSSDESKQSIEIALQSGFDDFNLDLMHGLPGQTTEAALADIKTALSYRPTHLSWYELTIEPNTVFYSKPPSLPDDSLTAELQSNGRAFLDQSNYKQYEVSAYAKENRQSQHNINYWSFGDYIGIGAGAHGKLSDQKSNAIFRTRKHKQPQHYLRSELSRVAEILEVIEADRPLEFLLNALRLRRGFRQAEFEQRTGVPFSTIAKKVESLSNSGMLALDKADSRVRATDKGYQLLNSVLVEFL